MRSLLLRTAPEGEPIAPRRAWFPKFAALLGVGVAALVLYPLVVMIPTAFVDNGTLNTEVFGEVWRDSGTHSALWNTLVIVGVSTTMAVVIGSAFAWLNERTDARIGWLSDALPIIPLMVPPLAGAIGWILLLTPGPGFLNVILRQIAGGLGLDLGFSGPLNIFSWYGLIFVYTLYLVPHAYLSIAAALRSLDPSLEEASRVSGASPWRTLRRVTLPAVRPAIAGGALLALVIGVALFSVPVLLGTAARIDVLSVRIVRFMAFQFPPDIASAVVLGLVLVAIIGTAWVLQARILGGQRHATIGSGRSGGTSKVELGRWRPVARAMMVSYLILTSIAPLGALLLVSIQRFWQPRIDFGALHLDNYRRVLFDNPETSLALRNSVSLGLVGATIAMATAAVIAYFIKRNRGNPIASIVDGVTKLPGAVSNVIIGIALIAAFVGPPFRLGGTLLLLFIGYFVLYMPQATVMSGSALGQVDDLLSEASLMSGAGQGRTFRKIVLPLMKPGLAAGWVFVFVLMAGDVTASVMLASTSTPVVGFVMLGLYNHGSFPLLATLGTIISVIMTTIVLSALYYTRRT